MKKKHKRTNPAPAAQKSGLPSAQSGDAPAQVGDAQRNAPAQSAAVEHTPPQSAAAMPDMAESMQDAAESEPLQDTPEPVQASKQGGQAPKLYSSVYLDNPFIPEETEKMSGLKIRSINVVVVTFASLLLLLFLLSSFQTTNASLELRNANDKYIECELAANQLKHASNYLTIQARMFAVTQDIKYMERYFEEAFVSRNREQATDVLKTYLSDTYAYLYLDEAYRYSYELMKREYRSMRLVAEAKNYILGGDAAVLNTVQLSETERNMTPDEKIRTAMNLTHDAYYQRYVDLIERCVNSCIASVTNERHNAEKANAALLEQLTFSQRLLAVLLMLVTVLTILTVIRLVLWPMNAFVTCIRHYQPLPMTGAYELRYLARAYNIMYKENQKTSAHLRHEAEHDALTSLYNRGTFDRLREDYKNLPIALMLIDVDKFKTINDSHGHDVGDQVLQKIARLLDQNFRETDFPCRVGGDEFAVIVTDVSSGMKNLLKDKLQRISDALQDTSDGVPGVTLSVGVAFNDREDGTEDIYKDADRALYVVKTHGRNGVEFYGEHYAKLAPL